MNVKCVSCDLKLKFDVESFLQCRLLFCTAAFFNLFIGTEFFGAFTLLSETHAATRWFLLFQMDRNVIILYLAGMLSPRNGLGLEAKNYSLGLVDAVSSASTVALWPHCWKTLLYVQILVCPLYTCDLRFS